MNTPTDIMYQESHEWIKVVDGVAYIGITDYAQDSLGDVVYVELPDEGATVQKGENFGAVESVKAASDLISPVSGTVVKVNTALDEAPEKINDDPFKEWMIQVKMDNDAELSDLMEASAYVSFCKENA